MQNAVSDYDLHSLGWFNFQQLCLTITREIFGQTVESFLDSKDGGRDGAFRGRWAPNSGDELCGAFVVQCKFTSKRNASLTLASLLDEVEKARSLVATGLCENYILMTNAGISGEREAELRRAFATVGVKAFRSYGSSWLSAQIRESSRLRSLVPRVYGLGDLSTVFDERVYRQTRVLIDSMREDLSKVVLTNSYDQAARALSEHGFVLLLGEPASGKTTIASLLAMAAIDHWKCPTMKLERADQVKQHWDPDSPSQMFWVDDAFGALQYEAGSAYAWNHVFVDVKAM